jgi:hypothetical protein
MGDLLEGELQSGQLAYRLERLRTLEYPTDCAIGILVAVNRTYAVDTIERHQDVLTRRGVVAFGKFLYARAGGDAAPFRSLSTLGRERHEGPAAAWFRERITARLGSGNPLKLLILDPDPPASMWVGNVTEALARTSPAGKPDFAAPEFAEHAARDVVPNYYWLEGQKRLRLKYHCNFWALIDRLDQIDATALVDMKDLETSAPVTLATAQLYPAEVSLSEASLRMVSPRPSPKRAARAAARGLSLDLAKLLRGLDRVEVVPPADEELATSPQDMIDQTAALAVRLERHGREPLGIRTKAVADGRGLREFTVTGGGRVAAGWNDGKWWIVGLSAQHPEGTRFWREMTKRWVLLRR